MVNPRCFLQYMVKLHYTAILQAWSCTCDLCSHHSSHQQMLHIQHMLTSPLDTNRHFTCNVFSSPSQNTKHDQEQTPSHQMKMAAVTNSSAFYSIYYLLLLYKHNGLNIENIHFIYFGVFLLLKIAFFPFHNISWYPSWSLLPSHLDPVPFLSLIRKYVCF